VIALDHLTRPYLNLIIKILVYYITDMTRKKRRIKQCIECKKRLGVLSLKKIRRIEFYVKCILKNQMNLIKLVPFSVM